MSAEPEHDAPSRWSETDTASVDAAGTLRRRLATWLDVRDLGPVSVDVVLAAYEALANSVEHAYTESAEAGTVTLTAIHDVDRLTITVADTGSWREPMPTPNRGRGLKLAAAVSDRMNVDHHDSSGTVVTLAWDLTGPHSGDAPDSET